MTAEFVRLIDTLQYEKLGEGPCITCIRSGRPAVSGSLGSDRQLAAFGWRSGPHGCAFRAGAPLIVGDRVVGAMNSYAYARDAFAEHAIQLGSRFATAAVSVYNTQLLASTKLRTTQLQQAWQPRGDRPGDRHPPQSLGRHRAGGVRPSHPHQPTRARQTG